MPTQGIGTFLLERLAAICGALLLAFTAQADTMLVFDGSNSMWEEINGAHKIDIAKDSIDVLLDEWPPSEPLGLVAYGHREARSCTDIEVLAAPGSTFGQIKRAVNSLAPQGRTPLTGALISASRTLINGDGDDPTLIVLTDGVETCNQDPCEVARILKQNRTDFVAHVIGFELSVPDQNMVACIAERTGGALLLADDQPSLELALVQLAQLIGNDDRRNASLANVLSSLTEAPEPAELESLLAAQMLSEDSQAAPVPSAETLTNTPDGIDRNDPSRILNEKVREVVAQSQNSNEADFPGTTVLAFGSAKVSFGVSLADGLPAEALFERPTWSIYERKGGARGKRLLRSMANFPVFELPIGDYLAVLEADNVMYNYSFRVKTTLPTEHTIALNLGRIELTVENPGLVDVYSFRFDRGPENPSVDMEVRGPWSETFLLPPGTYIVQGRQEGRRQTVGPLVLRAGGTIQADIDIR